LKLVRRTRTELIGTVVTADGVSRFEIDPGVGSGTLTLSNKASQNGTSTRRDRRGRQGQPSKNQRPDDTVKLVENSSNTPLTTQVQAPVGQVVRAILNTDGSVTVTEVIGAPDSVEAMSTRMLSRHQLPEGHTKATGDDAERIMQRRPQRNPLRRDLRDALVMTIDSDVSRDLDDALSVTASPDGSLRVWVHIADVAEHVRAGSVLDLAARETPTSVYLPNHVRPMLPANLSEDRLSLLPGVVRDTVTVEMRIDPAGRIRSVDVYESLIKSRRRVSYASVAAILAGNLSEGDRAIGDHDTPMAADEIETIRLLRTAATRLGFQRTARGGVDSNRFDPELPYTIDRSEDPAHQLVERLMVAANEAVAGWLEERGIPTLYRVHDQLDDEGIDRLEEIAQAFGFVAAFPRPLTAEAFAAFSAQLDGNRNAAAVWDALMGLLGRARYTTENKGHFGLGSGAYLHFTSPLRRYADLCVHRTIKAYLAGRRDFDELTSELETIAVRINDVARRADMAERDARVAQQLCEFGNRRRRMDGVVVSVSSRGVSVATAASPVSAVVPVRRLPKGTRLDERRRRVTGKGRDIAVGSRVQIRVEKVEPFAGRLEASLVV
jgi:ribonuclease R